MINRLNRQKIFCGVHHISFSVIPHSQTIYGSLVETFGPYFQVYTKNFKRRTFDVKNMVYVRAFYNLHHYF